MNHNFSPSSPLLRLASSCLCLAASPAHAILVNNLPFSQDGAAASSRNNFLATAFTLGATTGTYQLTSLTLHLDELQPNKYIYAKVLGDNLNSPDNSNLIASFVPPAALLDETASGAANYQFLVDANVSANLNPENTYWIVLGMSDYDFDQPSPSGLVNWTYTNTPGQSAGSLADWSIPNLIASAGTDGSNWVSETNTPYLMGLDGVPVAVPEPSSYALLLGLAATALHLRRKKTKEEL